MQHLTKIILMSPVVDEPLLNYSPKHAPPAAIAGINTKGITAPDP